MKMLTIRELSDKTGIPSSTVRKYVEEGKNQIATEKDWKGRKVVSLSDFRKFVKENPRQKGRKKKEDNVEKFPFDWEAFYRSIEKEGLSVREWLKKNGISKGRFYWIQKNKLYPTKKEKEAFEKQRKKLYSLREKC